MVGALAGVWGSSLFSRLSNGGFEDPKSDSHLILEETRERFGDKNADIVLLYRTDGKITDQQVVADVQKVLQDLPKADVKQVVPWFADKSGKLIGDDGHAGMVLVTLGGNDPDAKLDSFKQIQDDLAVKGLDLHIAGMFPVFDEINTFATDSIVKAEMIAILVVFMLSVLIFGSVVAALMPTIVGIAAIIGSFALLRTITLFADVNVFSVNIVTILGMGLAIDYALFVVTRFREELSQQPDTSRANAAAAVEIAMKTAGRTVLFSGLTVAVSLASCSSSRRPSCAPWAWVALRRCWSA